MQAVSLRQCRLPTGMPVLGGQPATTLSARVLSDAAVPARAVYGMNDFPELESCHRPASETTVVV